MSARIARRPWSELEDSLLRQAVEQSQTQLGRLNWKIIANHVPGRDRKACRKRWYQSVGSNVQSGHWRTDEDERLFQAVAMYGPSWARVAQVVQSRNGDQCLKRWRDSLDPCLDRRAWTEDEDGLLLRSVQCMGTNWSQIRDSYFPSRSALAVRHRYQALEKKQSREFQHVATEPFLFMDYGQQPPSSTEFSNGLGFFPDMTQTLP